jgi:hypothetical protein
MAQISLGTAASFSVLAGSAVTNTGSSVVGGNVGISPGTAVTGFPPGIVTPPSTIHVADAVAAQAQVDLTTAYNAILATPILVDLTGIDLGGLTLTPGVYGFNTSAQLTGTLTLDALGNPDAVFIFRIGSTLTTASGSAILVTNGGSGCKNVFWQIGSSATVGTATNFAGNILALTSITLTTGANVSGRLLARNGAVTLDNNAIPLCAPPVVCPVVSLNPKALAAGVVGTAYSQTVTASGGVAPYTYAVSSGALPLGLSLNSGTGAITGTPTTPGTFDFTITATDSNGCPGSQPYSIVIAAAACPPILLSPTTLPSGRLGTPYSQTVTASGGVAPYTYAVSSGVLPPGLSLDSVTGAVSGTPTTGGIFNFTITATDSNGCPGSQAYSISIAVCPVLTLSPATLPGPVVGTPYSQTVTASGGTAPYTYAITSGALPTGLSLNSSTGAITGTPTASGGFSFIITATDANGCKGLLGYTVTAACPAITLSPNTLPVAVLGIPYSQTVTASGGIAPYTYVVSSGMLPTGLSLNSSTGAITGTPTAAGLFNFTITATDMNGCTGSQPYSMVVAPPTCPPITLSPATLPNPVVGTPYSQTVTASGGAAPYSYAVTSGVLPAGLSLDSATGAITGIPTTAGTSSFTITAIDRNACPGSQPYSTVTAPPTCPTVTLSPPTLPSPVVGTPYSQTVTASGGTAPYIYTVSSGALPTGLLLNSATGAITGIPTTAGTFSFTITATDNNDCPGSRPYSIGICPIITVRPLTLPTPVVGIPYSQTITASGGIAPYTYVVSSGALPTGLSLDSATGALTGTPTAAGIFAFTITATDQGGCPGSQPYSVVICPVLTLSPATLPAPVVGIFYSQTVTASGGTAPYTYFVTSGALPNGLSLDSATGAITGTTIVTGAFSFTITARDANGCTTFRGYTGTLEAVPAAIPALSWWGLMISLVATGLVSIYLLRRAA